ncbi:uncharacterized protein LOC123258289 [Drosophila ananassae]|uniref:uncharacterized protein LOC123258289 n=1 Tax=Drosophila ananassae TaxID=7217 RepID=UPI001D0008AE|nr:uncharacterized protein LOC123258289 [Drosophila ananassae]
MLPPDKNKLFSKSTTIEQKYIVIKRKDNISLEHTNPFIIKKSIDYTCGGEVDKCKTTRAGTLLVLTKNTQQAEKLLKITKIGTIDVEAKEHKSLNETKGIIYCNLLRYVTEEEILDELKSQKVSHVYKWTKMVDQTRVPTGLITLTFATTNLPEKVMIGYEVVFTRPYIPRPMQCKKCLRFNHPQTFCKQENPTCKNCSDNTHTSDSIECRQEPKCINCRNNHSSLDKKCPVFLKEQELIAIKITERVDHKTARSIYLARHNPSQESSYSQTLKNTTHTAISTKIPEDQPQSTPAKEIKATTNSIDDLLKELDNKIKKTNNPPKRTSLTYELYDEDEDMDFITSYDSQKPSTSANARILRSQTKAKSTLSKTLKAKEQKTNPTNANNLKQTQTNH